MLTLRKAQLAQSVQEELTRLHLVEARLDQIAAYGQMQDPDVVVKSVPAQRYLALRDVLPDVAAVRRLVSRISTAVPAIIPHSNLGQIAIVIHSPMFDPDAFDFEVGYLLTGQAPRSGPAGRGSAADPAGIARGDHGDGGARGAGE